MYFAVVIFTSLCFIGDINAKSINKESIRFVPFKVVYDFHGESEIKDAELIKIKHVKVFKEDRRSMFYLGVINNSNQPLSLLGEVIFFDKSGEIIYHQGKQFDGSSKSLSEFFGQATLGFSEGVDMEQGFEEVDIQKIHDVKIIIRYVFIDTADRD